MKDPIQVIDLAQRLATRFPHLSLAQRFTQSDRDRSVESSLYRQAISSITHDSRRVKEGSLYVALAGRVTHGARFITQAIERGAVAVALPTDTPRELQTQLNHSSVATLWLSPALQREEMAWLSEWIYGSPISQEKGDLCESLQLIGITGTNGKTTTSTLLADILTHAEGDAGLIGTIETRGGGIKRSSSMTTMESTDLHQHYRSLLDAGVRRCVMEVSSIGIEESRVAASLYSRAAFLNLSEDHLDYHIDMDRYAEAKLRLFSEQLAPNALCVICVDGDDRSRSLSLAAISACSQQGVEVWRYSSLIKPTDLSEEVTPCEVYWRRLSLSPLGISGVVCTPRGEYKITSPLMGDFNASNIAVAVAIASSLSIEERVISEAILSSQICGRMEIVGLQDLEDSNTPSPLSTPKSLPAVRVDYAHTPDALERAIRALRDHHAGKLWVLFGCGGDRDALKRPLMGSATALADGVVITSDNPRDEEPISIINDILPGVKESGKGESLEGPHLGKYWIEVDRGIAIHRLIASASDDDLILIAGKGHEPYQELKEGQKLSFSDQAYAQQALLCRRSLSAISDSPKELRSLSSWSLCASIGGLTLLGQHRSLEGAEIDSRQLTPDKPCAFFCLQGQRDGHHFIPMAIENGAGAIVVKRGWRPSDELKTKIGVHHLVIIETGEPERALALWASAHRDFAFTGLMVGLTGSNGKTSTKELLAAALNEIGPTLSTFGNFNNHLGVPLTLLRLRSAHRYAVIEMGMNAPGEIEQLATWARPDLGLITTIAPAHLEGLGSVEAVAQAKGELITALRDRPVLMPASIPVALRSEAAKASLVQGLHPQVYLMPISTKGESKERVQLEHEGDAESKLLPHENYFWPPLYTDSIELSPKGSLSRLWLHTRDDQLIDCELTLQMLGRHQIENARLALAAGLTLSHLELKDSPKQALNDSEDSRNHSRLSALLRGMARCAPAQLRGELLNYHRPIRASHTSIVHNRDSSQGQLEDPMVKGRLWLDCYNANPQSMIASVKTFFESGEEGTLILGSIGELGEHAPLLHRELGQDLASLLKPRTTVITVGDQAEYIGQGLAIAGFDSSRRYHFNTEQLDLIVDTLSFINPRSILVKGSRSVRLERLIPLLDAQASSSHPLE